MTLGGPSDQSQQHPICKQQHFSHSSSQRYRQGQPQASNFTTFISQNTPVKPPIVAVPDNVVLGPSFQLAYQSSSPHTPNPAYPQTARTDSATPRQTPSKRSFTTMLDYDKSSSQLDASKPPEATNSSSSALPPSAHPNQNTAPEPAFDMRPIHTQLTNAAPHTAATTDTLGDPIPDTNAPHRYCIPARAASDFLILNDPVSNIGNIHLHLPQLHGHHFDQVQHNPHSLLAQDDELATAQRLYDVTIDSPGAAFKRRRSCADSDAGSSSCKDMDEPDVLAPDSVPALVSQIRQLLNYVASKPTLQNASASFMRDYLRTMLIQNSIAAEEAIQTSNRLYKSEITLRRKANECFRKIPDELAKHILSFLDGHNLSRAREVCRKWNEFASDDQLWKTLCLKRWRSLQVDKDIWRLIDRSVDLTRPTRWRQIYPKVSRTAQWKCRLQKTGRFICNLVAHQLSGSLGEAGLPSILVVERRFNIMHLQTFVLPEATILYFEPEEDCDRPGFEEFIEYLHKRTRAGLALEDQRRFIFIPPCDYTRNIVNYHGKSLLGVVQIAYPPLAPP